MKVVINKCYGGFSLSREALALLAKKQRRACYFFSHSRKSDGGIDINTYAPDDGQSMFFYAFDIPNPNEVLAEKKPWAKMTDTERAEHNAMWEQHTLDTRQVNRADPLLIEVVEELGERASGAVARLKVVEIPDGIQYEITEYDGMETVEEAHRSWG